MIGLRYSQELGKANPWVYLWRHVQEGLDHEESSLMKGLNYS
jgi:hypothetical protein